MIVIIGNLNTISNDSKRESSSNFKRDTNDEKLSLGNIKIIIIGVENINIKPMDFTTNNNPFTANAISNNNNKSNNTQLNNTKINEKDNSKEQADEGDTINKYPIKKEFSFNAIDNFVDASFSINEKKSERDKDNNYLKKSDGNAFDFSFQNSFKSSKNSSNTKVHTILFNNSNNETTSPSFDKSSLNANRKYKEDQINDSSNYSDHKKHSFTQNIGNPNPLLNLKDKESVQNNHNSNKEVNNLDVGKILNSKVYENDKLYEVENINNFDLVKETIHNSDNFLSMDKIENSLRDNFSDKREIRNSSKSIATINSAFTDLNETKKNKIKLTFNSQNIIMTNQSATNNTLSGTNNITHFTVLEHDEIDLKDFIRNDYEDSFCEAFFHAGLVAKKVKMIPDSDNFIPPCKHKNCAILNAYRPEIIECFPGSVVDGIEINSTVIKFYFYTLFII